MAALKRQAASVGNVTYLALAPITTLLVTHTALPVVLGWLVDLVAMVPPSIALLEVEHYASGPCLDLTHNIIKGAVLKPFILLIMTSVLYTTSGFGLSALFPLSLGF